MSITGSNLGAMNVAFAKTFKPRDLAVLSSLYEPDAALRTDGSDRTLRGRKVLP